MSKVARQHQLLARHEIIIAGLAITFDQPREDARNAQRIQGADYG